MKSYNAIGYLIILLYLLACVYSAPAQMGPLMALLIGGAYFIFCWFTAGLYLADVLHLGIAHRSLDYKEWFIKLVSAVNNVVMTNTMMTLRLMQNQFSVLSSQFSEKTSARRPLLRTENCYLAVGSG